jgi:hypothetical protein
VAADVRIKIENYKVVRGAVDDQVPFIVFGVALSLAEYAGLDTGRIRPGNGDVAMSPGAPESIHRQPIPFE